MKNLLKLPGILLLGIVVLALVTGCTPKSEGQSQETETAESQTQLEVESQPEAEQNIAPELPQGFSRTIELASPRMNGQDVLELQNRLLSLGYSGVGAADGYFGPMGEAVIKNIQAFSGFESDGKVDRTLWGYLFDNSNTALLQNISAVLTYDKNNLTRTTLFADEPGDENAHIYHSNQTIRIVEYDIGTAATELLLTYYFVNDTYYFTKEQRSRWDFETNTRIIDEDNMRLVNNNDVFIIKNGNLERDNDHSVIRTKNFILEAFLGSR